jgi:hypothetical protein
MQVAAASPTFVQESVANPKGKGHGPTWLPGLPCWRGTHSIAALGHPQAVVFCLHAGDPLSPPKRMKLRSPNGTGLLLVPHSDSKTSLSWPSWD